MEKAQNIGLTQYSPFEVKRVLKGAKETREL